MGISYPPSLPGTASMTAKEKHWKEATYLIVAAFLALGGLATIGFGGAGNLLASVGAGCLVGLTDIYLLRMLWCCASLSAGKGYTWPGVPGRQSAVGVVLLLSASLTLGFARFTYDAVPNYSRPDALYDSFVRLTSFTYTESTGKAWPQGLQLLSGIILLLCAIPIVISRITDLDRSDDIAPASGVKVAMNEVRVSGTTVSLPAGFSAATVSINDKESPLASGPFAVDEHVASIVVTYTRPVAP